MFDKAYLIRAFYQWCIDNKYTPEIQISVSKDSHLTIPKECIHEDGTAIINISKGATKFLEIENEKIYVEVMYGDKLHRLGIDIGTVDWIRAFEIEEYLYINNKYEDYYTAVQKNLTEEKKQKQVKASTLIGMEPKIIEKWIIENSGNLTQLFSLKEWYIKYIVIKQGDKISKENENDPDGCAGDCQSSYEYKSATIRIFASEVKNEEELKRVIVHELAHVATSSFELYSKYFEDKILHLSSEKGLYEKLRYDIYELLAMQIESIVLGKMTNKIVICENKDRADEQFRMHCQKYGVTSHSIITDSQSKTTEKSPLEIIEEEKKYDPDFWYENYRKAVLLKEEQKLENKTEKEKQSILEQKRDLRTLYCKDSNAPKIVIPSKVEDKNYDFKKIILLGDYKKAA